MLSLHVTFGALSSLSRGAAAHSFPQKHLAKALFWEYARACMSLVTMGAGYFGHWAAFVWGSLANDNACEMPGKITRNAHSASLAHLLQKGMADSKTCGADSDPQRASAALV